MKLKKLLKHITDDTYVGIYANGENVYNDLRYGLPDDLGILDYLNYKVDKIWTGQIIHSQREIDQKINISLKG